MKRERRLGGVNFWIFMLAVSVVVRPSGSLHWCKTTHPRGEMRAGDFKKKGALTPGGRHFVRFWTLRVF
jgi:hypothetical protein